MRLEPLSDALKIWEKDKYVDINNFYYNCPKCEDTYSQTGHAYVDQDGNKYQYDCPVCDESEGGHIVENENENDCDNHHGLTYRIYPVQTWNTIGCKTCEIIDYLCNLYYRDFETNTVERNSQLINEILSYEINAYKLLKQRESFGFIYQQLDGEVKNDKYVEGIYDMTHYLYSSKYNDTELEKLKVMDSDINKTRIDQARWCSVCGARKPNVIFDQNK